MAVETLPALATLAAIIGIGYAGYLLFERTRITDVLILIGLGVLVGPVLGLLSVEAFRSATAFVGTLALIVIMFDGGLGLRLKDLAAGLGRAMVLAVLGFGLTIGAVAAVGHYAMDMSWPAAALLGMIVGGTSGVVVMPIVARTRAANGTRVLLSVESALTDVFCVVGVVTLVGVLASPTLGASASMTAAAKAVAASFSVAIIVGLVIGFSWLRLMGALTGKRNVYMATLAAVLLLYVGTEFIGGSGAIGVLAFGIVLGNGSDLMKRFGLEGRAFSERQKEFQGEITFLVRAFFFVYLGVILDPAILTDITFLLFGGLILLAIVAARLVSVPAALMRERATRGDRGLITFLFPRGLAATVLAGIPPAAGIAGTENFLAYAFIVVAATNIVGTVAVWAHERRVGARAAVATTSA